MNLANLFDVDWNLCTDAQAKANDHWWRALKNFKFVPKTNPTGSKLVWRGGGANCPLRSLEELAAYRFEAVRRILNLQGCPLKYSITAMMPPPSVAPNKPTMLILPLASDCQRSTSLIRVS